MDFDDMLLELGELGKFQVTTYILICLPVFFAAANSLSYVFTAGIPNYRCFIPECENKKNASYKAFWTKWAIPSEISDQVLNTKSTFCERYSINHTLFYNSSVCSPDLFTKNIEKCDQWVFSKEEYTIVNDWNLTCIDNQWKLSLVGTSHFAGIVVGSALFGILADKYGRKNVLVFCNFLLSLSGMAQIISPNYNIFIIFMFINAMGTAGVYPLAFIIGVELVGKKKREITGIVLNYFYAAGEAVVALIAWYTRNWMLLQLIVSAPAMLFLTYYWLIPESVRWLFANNKNELAKDIVYQLAKINKVPLSDNIKDSLKEKIPLTMNVEPLAEDEDKIIPVVKAIVKSRTLVIRFLIVCLIWAVNAFVFYGLSVNSTSISGDKYLNFALVSLVEIPGYTLAWICINKIGRRLSLVFSLLLCGITCAGTVLIPSECNWGVITMFLIGKLGITSAFGVVYVHTAEMLPTVIRSGGVGLASTIARLGALLAPFIPLLTIYSKPLPMLLFGAIAIFAGLIAVRLPETLGTKLPETVKEAEKL